MNIQLIILCVATRWFMPSCHYGHSTAADTIRRPPSASGAPPSGRRRARSCYLPVTVNWHGQRCLKNLPASGLTDAAQRTNHKPKLVRQPAVELS